eukprot:PhF_6_TR40452/c0_g1_i1/m.60420
MGADLHATLPSRLLIILVCCVIHVMNSSAESPISTTNFYLVTSSSNQSAELCSLWGKINQSNVSRNVIRFQSSWIQIPLCPNDAPIIVTNEIRIECPPDASTLTPLQVDTPQYSLQFILSGDTTTVVITGCTFYGSLVISSSASNSTLSIENSVFLGPGLPVSDADEKRVIAWDDTANDMRVGVSIPQEEYTGMAVRVHNITSVSLRAVAVLNYTHGGVQITSSLLILIADVKISLCYGMGGLRIIGGKNVLVTSFRCFQCVWTIRYRVSSDFSDDSAGSGAITLFRITNVTLRNITTNQTRSIFGSAAILLHYTQNVVVEDSNLANCIGVGTGGCVWSHYTPSIKLRNTTVDTGSSLTGSGGCIAFTVTFRAELQNVVLNNCASKIMGGAVYFSASSGTGHYLIANNVTLVNTKIVSIKNAAFCIQGGLPAAPLIHVGLRNFFLLNSTLKQNNSMRVPDIQISQRGYHIGWSTDNPLVTFVSEFDFDVNATATATKPIRVNATLSSGSNVGLTKNNKIISGSLQSSTAMQTALGLFGSFGTANVMVAMFDSTCSDNMLQGVAKESSWGLSPLHFLAGSMHPTLTDGTS